MSGFFEDQGQGGSRGFFSQATPAADEGIGGAINIPGLDDILASEGAQRVKPVLQAILAQESGGNPKVRNSVDGAQGIGQLMPATFKRFAKQGERIDNPADNLRVAARFMNFLHDRAGGDPAKMAAGYFSGEGNIGTDRAYKTDHADGNGKRVSSYVADVMGRLGAPAAQPQEPAAQTPAAPSWSEFTNRPAWKNLTAAEKELGRAEYFNRYIAPTVSDDERAAAKSYFIEQSQAHDPKEPGILDKVVDAIKSVPDSLKSMPDPLRDSMDKRSVMERLAGQIPEAAPAAPKDAAITPRGLFAELNQQDILPSVTARAQETRDIIDPSAEARTRRLISQGMNVDQAKYLGEAHAEAGTLPGEEGGVARMEKTDFDFATRKKYNEDPFYSHAGVRALVKGGIGYMQGARGLAQFGAEMADADDLAADLAASAKKSRGFTDAMGTPTDHLQRNFEGAVSSIATQLPALIGGAVTGSEALTLGSMFAQTFGTEYSDGRAQGQTQGEAAQRASLFAAFEVIGERFGLGEQLKLMRNAARGVETKALTKFLANTLTKELPGEMLTTTGQFAVDKLGDIGLNRDAGMADYLQQMADTVTQTFMQGGMMSAGVGGLNAGMNKLDERLQGRAAEKAADAAQRDALNKWRNNGLSPNGRTDGRKEPTLDEHAAGLTPDQQAVDAMAQEAFGDLLQDDEIPASTLLGVEAPANSEAQEPASMRVPEEPVLEEQPTAAPTPEGKKTKLTPFEHPDLDDVEIRGELAYMADQAGWAQVGGKMIRADGTDQTSDVTGRTPWIPKQPWYQMMPERLNEEQTIEAVGKALTGQPMTAKEKRVIANMLDFAKASLEEQKKWHVDAMDAVGATSTAEYAEVGQHADAVEAMDADIPLDLTDPRLTAGNTLNDEELDGVFGTKQSTGVPEKPVAGNADENAQGTGAPSDAGSETFQLQGETPEEVRAKERETEKTKAAERKAKADQDAKEKAEREKKDIRARGDAAAENFQLGEDPEAALSGQKDIFGDAPTAPKGDAHPADDLSDVEALAILGMYRGGGITRDAAKARKHLKDDFAPADIKAGLESLAEKAPFKPTPGAVYVDQHGKRTAPFPTSGKVEDGEAWLRSVADIASRESSRKTGDPSFIDGISKKHPPSFGTPDFNVLVMTAFGDKGLTDANLAPKTEKQAKAKKEKTDFDSMFDDIAAEEKPKTEKEAIAKREAGDNGIPAGVPNGQWGNVDHPMRFMSGLSRPGDFKNVFGKGAHVGITVGELSAPSYAPIGKAMTEANRYLFVDSGAFSLFQGIKRAKLQGVDTAALPKALDFDEIMDSYRMLAQEIGKADDHGYANDRVFFVMPDIVGDQKGSLDLVSEYAPWIGEMGVNAIVPLQSGEMSLTKAYEAMMARLGLNPDMDASPVIGIPTAQMAASDAELTALLKEHGDRIMGIHILGGVSDSTLAPRLAAIRAAGYDGNVSADGAAWRGAMNSKKGVSRGDAIDRTIEKLYGKKAEKTNFDAMFDEIAAEERPAADKPKAEKPAHEMTRTEYRADEATRGKTGGLKAASINPDNETVESLLKNHRASIPFLGMLMGAKGGKNVPKMAADIMRIWKLRGELSKATVDGLLEKKAPELKELAKQVGIYSHAPKKQLAEGIIKWRDAQRSLATERLQDAKHFKAVRAALANGQPVRSDVVKAYPELVAEHYSRETPEYLAAIQSIALQARTSDVGLAAPYIAKAYRDDAAKTTGKESEVASDIADAIEAAIARQNQPVERTIGEAAASAAVNTGKGMKNAALGLAALFGSEVKGGTPRMGGLLFNKETYAQAKPMFIEAVSDAQNAGADVKEVLRKLFVMVRDLIGYDDAVKMKPYMVRFMEEYEEGTHNEPATGSDTQQDGADHGNEAPGRDNPVYGGPEGAGPADPQHGGQAGGEQDTGAATGLGVHDAGTPAGGTGRSDGVSEPNGELGIDRSNSESDDATGSGTTGTGGTTATDGEADGDVSTADGASDVEIEQTFAEKVDAQKKAEKIPVVLGDRANIDATLPLLMAAQREDVHFAEKRLAKPTGYGVLFANGTGTGKTYLSLGIVKRMLRTGKTNGIVIVPNQEVMNEWLASAPNLGIELYQLGDKQDKGQGVSITTYANYGDNMKLLDREHDFVVADEAHNLMASKDADVTLSLEMTRAITKHPESAHTRTKILHNELHNKIQTLRAREQKLLDERAEGKAGPGSAELLNKIGEELRPLYKEWDKALEAQKEIVRSVKPEERARLVAVSATPFAWEKNVQWAEGYLFNYDSMERTGAYNEPSPYQKYMISNFGWHMKNGKLNEPDAKVNRSLMQIQYNMRLRKAGVLSTRMLKVDKDYDRRFVLVDGGIGARIDAALQWLRKGKDGRYARYHDYANKKFDFLTKSRLLEAIKAKAAIDIIKQHHALGRKVVVFHDFNEGGGFEPFYFPGREDQVINIQTGYGATAQKFTYTHGEFLADFAREFPDLVGGDLGDLKSPIETLREAFPNALFNNGTEKKKDALQAIKDFNNDEKPGANLLVVQSAKNAGWSGHDRSGKFQRVSINLGLPTAPVKSIQLEGRIYRTGQMSDAIFRYLNTGTYFERFAFATAIATRSETAENLAMGEDARGLKRSFIDAFNDSGDFPASLEDGRGGKEQDRASNTMTPFKKAISYYYANHKKNSKTKAAEGVDYFPTPEPLGLKMVEWLEPKAGRDYLEPSAGHGAIARWFPDDVNVKAIEPSTKLAADLSLNMFDPTSVINDTFEGHYIGNKYDGIAMNPPFGQGGKTAMEHVAKAFGHLKEGGRLIAIVPAGPSMDKRLEQWLTGTVTNTRGVTSMGNPDAVFTAMLQLPPSTFGRAGTSVSTRLIVIDKVKGGNTGRVDPQEQVFLTNAAWEGDVNSMFNDIEHLKMPPRPAVSQPAAGTAESTNGVTMHAHGRVVEDAAQAVFKVVGNKLETDAPIAKVTTKGGKELEGVYVPDRETAKAVDQFTWKPSGAPGFFVRIKHVIRPTDQKTAFSKPTGRVPRSQWLSVAEITQRAQKITDQFKTRIPVEVVDTVADIPGHANSTDVASGATTNDRIYLVREGLRADNVEITLFHEMLHFGVRRFLPENKYVAIMHALYTKDAWVKNYADAWMTTSEAASLRSQGYSDDYIKARGVDEALAYLAETLNTQPTGFRTNTPSAKVYRAVRDWIAALARMVRLEKLARRWQAYAAQQDARQFVETTFNKLRTGHAPSSSTGWWKNADTSFRREESARSVNLRPAVKAKTGLLDTPMRLAMQKTGALAVWRGAFRLLEKTASRALDNKVGEIIKAGLIDRYGLSDAVIERHEEMRVQMIAGVRTSQRFLDRLQGLSRAEYAVLYAAANNADIEAVNDMIRELPEESQKVLHEIKSLVRDLGQDAVDLKMLDVDTFKANEMAYLHRSYLKHEADLTAMEKSNRATRIKGDQFKQRGLADVVSSDRLMKWMPEFWGTRVKNGAVTNGTVGQVFIRLERRDDPRETPNLEGIEGTKPLGRLKEVVYWPQGEEIPAKFGDWHNEGEWTIRRTHGKNVVFRRDFTQEERRRMGEIEDIRYAMAKTINIAVHDVEVGKYFAWLAEGHAKVPGDLPRGAEVIDDPYKAESRLQAFTKDVWVKVPDVKIKDTNVSAYGKLAGRYIPGPIWTDIRHVANGAFYSSKFGQNYEKLLRLWKLSKTALSPAVHVNNVMANVVMADWHDIGGKHLLQAAAAWARQGKDADAKRLVEDFQDHGGELGTFALNEMQRDQLAPILDELLKEAREANDLNGVVNAASVMSLLREGMVRQAAATLGQSKAGRVATSIPRKMIDVYQLEDQIFRLAAFIKAKESGLNEREAGRYARKSFLDYDIQAPWVVAAKRSGLLPFISFSYRAIPMLYETVRDKPWKLMKLALILGGVSAASAAFLGLDDDDEKDERRWLPDEKSGKVWGMIPKLVRMPWNTSSDNPVFLDIRRFIPAGDITDTGATHGAVPLPPFLTVGGPLALMVELYADKSLFTGKELNQDRDSKVESAVKVLDHVYKWAAPNIPLPTLGTIVPGVDADKFQTYAWTGIAKAWERESGTFGRDQNVPMAVGSALGIKLEGYSKTTGMVNARGKLGQTLKELRNERAGLAKQRAVGGLAEADYVRRVKGNQEKTVDVTKEFVDRATK